MSCLALSITIPTFNVPGLSIGFALPSIALDADLCCKIKVGPFPAIPPVASGNLLGFSSALMVPINAAILAYQVYIDELLTYTNIDCPLD